MVAQKNSSACVVGGGLAVVGVVFGERCVFDDVVGVEFFRVGFHKGWLLAVDVGDTECVEEDDDCEDEEEDHEGPFE